jgi:nucleotide-binding universal stress UspA family protein
MFKHLLPPTGGSQLSEAAIHNGVRFAKSINAKVTGFYLIMMASHGRRGVQGLLLGSETHKVLTHGKIPVLVHR